MAVKLFPCGFDIPCQVYACSRPARWYLGRDDGPVSLCMTLCDTCARELVDNLPAKLKPISGEADVQPSRQSYNCPKCGKAFDNRHAMAVHARWCEGEENGTAVAESAVVSATGSV